MEVFRMKFMRRTLGQSVVDRIKNRDKMGKYGNRNSLLKRVDQSILRWFGHMEGI